MKKTILITGSTDGIGKLVAIKLAKAGNEVYLHGRDEQKLTKAIKEIKEASKNENVKGFIADFSNLTSVKQLAQKINQELPKLDILINNAGIFKTSTSLTKDGVDIRLTVNYLAVYLFTQQLLPTLKKGLNPRIINLSSAAQAPVSLSALKGQKQLSAQEAYAQSKLALTMWSFDLAKKEKELCIIAVNPGSLLNTKMANEAYGQHWSSASKGADILYELSILDEYKNDSGKYFDNDKGEIKGDFSTAHSDAYDEAKIEELIATTDDILTKIQ